MKPGKGMVALCSFNCLGLITVDEPQEVTYPDGNNGIAWTGIHLTDRVVPMGSPWSSRNPIVIGHINTIAAEYASVDHPELGIKVVWDGKRYIFLRKEPTDTSKT